MSNEDRQRWWRGPKRAIYWLILSLTPLSPSLSHCLSIYIFNFTLPQQCQWAAMMVIKMLWFSITFYSLGIRGLLAKWTDETSVRCEKCTVIMLTLRGWNSVEWVNQFILYNRGFVSGNWKTDGTCHINISRKKKSQSSFKSIFRIVSKVMLTKKRSNVMFL